MNLMNLIMCYIMKKEKYQCKLPPPKLTKNIAITPGVNFTGNTGLNVHLHPPPLPL